MRHINVGVSCTFFTLALMAALLLARGAGATSVGQGDGPIYDTVRNVTLLPDGNPCVTVGNCVNLINPVMPLGDVNISAANLSSGGFTDRDLPSRDVNGDSNRLTGNQDPSTNIESIGSGLFATSATLFLIGVGFLILGLVLRRL
jgi:hypothetical protein